MKKIITAIIALYVCLTSVLNTYAVSYSQVRSKTAVANTPLENLFRLEGTATNYVLLDSTEEGYMIVPQGYSGSVMYDPDATVWFDLEDTNNIAYWLNNTFITDGILPKEMSEHLVERDWPMEDPIKDSNDMFVRCKVALLSQTELLKYNSKFGFKDGYDGTNDTQYFFLRSRSGQTILVGNSKGATDPGKPARNYGTKPVFFLDNNFFKEHKIDLVNIGDNVRKAILDKTTDAELKKVYSDYDIKKLKREYPPQALSVKCVGLPMTGQVLKCEYTYYSPSGIPEQGTIFRWLVADTVNGTYYPIPGATSPEYTVEKKYQGKYIRAEVTPQTATMVGRTVMSETRDLYMEEAFPPEAGNVVFMGDPYVGNRLVLDYNYFDANQDLEGDTRIIFQISRDGIHFSDHQDARNRVEMKIPVTFVDGRSGNERYFENYNSGENYIVKPEDAGCYIRGKIVPRSENYPYTGKVVYTEPVLAYERPVAKISIKSKANSYEGSYTFDGKMDKTDSSVSGWEYSGGENGTYSVITNEKIYTPKNTGYYRFFVIPQNGMGQKGEKVFSEPVFYEDGSLWEREANVGELARIIPEKSSNAYLFVVKTQNPESVKAQAMGNGGVLVGVKDGIVNVLVYYTGENSADASKEIVTLSADSDMIISDMSCVIEGNSEQIGFKK